MQKIRKAVIPVAGLGTRFLPATKTVPKELLPIIDRPILLHVVQEAVAAGIEDIIFIAGRGKGAIEDFFDISYELEEKLKREGKETWLDEVKGLRERVRFISIRQQVPLGLGHAVLCAEPVVQGEPFAVLLGDEIMVAPAQGATVTQQLTDLSESTGLSTVAVMKVAPEETRKYGIVEGSTRIDGDFTRIKVANVIEKPNPGETQSTWALPGRYVFSGEIFNYLRLTRPGRNGEIQLTDAMNRLAQQTGLIATTFTSRRFDAGDKLGYLIANIELGLEHPEIKQGLAEYLKKRGT